MIQTLHVVGLPWTETTQDYLSCAYSQKLFKFAQMFPERTILYAGASNTAPCLEHVPLLTAEERIGWFGPWDPNGSVMRASWDVDHPAWVTLNARAISALRDRLAPHDLILPVGGTCHQPIAVAFPGHLTAEWAVGYEGIFANYCAFESYAWMHHIYGLKGWRNGRYYDTVIPNFFDPDDFQIAEKTEALVFLGRITQRKGPHVASDIAKACGRQLLVAGPGASAVTPLPGGGCRIMGDAVTLEGAHLVYVGPVNVRQRALLLSRAAAVLMPTLYVEPFGGVAVEAMLSGTPVVANNWGAFSETVEEGITGARFRTLQDGADAVERVQALDPHQIRQRAIERFSLEAVRPHFERWFDQLDGLWGDGWTALRA